MGGLWRAASCWLRAWRKAVLGPLTVGQHPGDEQEIGSGQLRTSAANALDDGGGPGGVVVDGAVGRLGFGFGPGRKAGFSGTLAELTVQWVS